MQNPKRRNSKPKFRKRETEESSEDKFQKGRSKINDPSWYVKEPQLAKDVASFSFNNALGAQYILTDDTQSSVDQIVGTEEGLKVTPQNITDDIPGILVLPSAPAVNPSSNAYSALNLATKDLYKRVRKMNSGSTNYDAPDLMLYILAMDSIYSSIFFLQRIYGCANVYSQVNRFVGDAFIEAQGVYPETVRRNLADFRARINMLITKVSAFATPTDMALFKRHSWMYQGMYTDEAVKKAQVFMYVPSYVYKYNEISGQPGFLEPHFLSGVYARSGIRHRTSRTVGDDDELITISDLCDKVEEMIQAVVESQDMNTMSGDILKAYGDNVWRMTLIDENYATVPIYSDEVLDQIHNTTYIGSVPLIVTKNGDDYTSSYSTDSLKITQVVDVAGNYLVYQPIVGGTHMAFNTILDMSEDNPTPERVLVATRNMVCGDVYTAKTGPVYTRIYTCGSDMVFFGVMYAMSSNGLVHFSIGRSDQTLADYPRYAKFHRAPLIYYMASNTELDGVYGELGNFTLISHNDMRKLHESATLSLLGVSI